MFYGWWIVIIGCIFDAVKGGTYNTGLTPFVVAYGLVGLLLCWLPAPEPPAHPAVRVAS